MPSELRSEVVTDLGVARGAMPEWHALAEQCHLPYATPGWMLAFARHIHGPASLRVVLVRDAGGELVGVAPFYCRDRRWAGLLIPEYRLLSDGIGSLIAPLAKPGREPEVAAAFTAALREAADPRPAFISLDAMEGSSPWVSLLREEWGGPRPTAFARHSVPAPAVTLRDDHETWLSERSGHFRSHLRRFSSRARNRGGRLRRSGDLAEARRDVEALFRLHDAQRQSLGEPSTMSEQMRSAVRDAVEDLFPAGAVRLWVMDSDDGVVAAYLLFCAGDRITGFNNGIDPAWQRESLGLILLERVVRDAHESGLGTLDMGAGDAPYKRRFADAEVTISWRALAMRDGHPAQVAATHGALFAIERAYRLGAWSRPARERLRQAVDERRERGRSNGAP